MDATGPPAAGSGGGGVSASYASQGLLTVRPDGDEPLALFWSKAREHEVFAGLLTAM